MTKVKLRWLNNPSSIPVGMTWGIPWKEGELRRDEPLRLTVGQQGAQHLQSWPTAFWPDGSVKWSAHAAVVSNDANEEFHISKGSPKQPVHHVEITETEEFVTIHTGAMICHLKKQGRHWLQSIVQDGIQICNGGQIVCLKEERDVVPFESYIEQMTVEQSGPIRGVIKLEGKLRCTNGASRTKEWLPFVMRLYVYAGQTSFKLVLTFLYDGNPNEDFIKGLGIRFSVPMKGPLYNRHVRFAGDSAFFSESPKTLHTRRTKGKYRDLFERQTNGEKVTFSQEEDSYFLRLLADSATWDSFKLVQDSSEHYRLLKRTKEECCWLKVTDGRRAGGLGFVGSEAGGLAVGLRNFWKKHPSGFEVHGMSQNDAELTVWFWSPDSQTMDLRHYDTETHVESSYEGAEELRATPYGIANTSELMVWCTSQTPTLDELSKLLEESQNPSLFVCEPEHYHETGAFGLWSLPDRSTALKSYLEDRLDGIVDFYQKEVEQRKWYGFWDYGDFMHSYDPVRHVWNYDLGGCAWQNTELAPNMWLWYLFLRSGREDIFRMAEAMTRHTSEVDLYHFGEYAGLGSRHNVVHWGCGCKEARIGMAGLHRFYYYLTADERIGDILDEVKDSDFSTVTLDPMRAYFPKDEHPTHIRVGPDWAAFSSNWMTRWERYEDTSYREKILTGVECIKNANYRLLSGPTYGYDPETSKLIPIGDDNYDRHLAICMGGPQVWFELADMLKDPEWEEMLAELGVYYNLTQDAKDLVTHGNINHKYFGHPVLSAAIMAYGAYYRKDEVTASQCWSILLNHPFAKTNLQESAITVKHVDSLQEIDWMNTNEAAQWSLNTIISLAVIPEALPIQYEEVVHQ